jgi:hypothetical protein
MKLCGALIGKEKMKISPGLEIDPQAVFAE